MSEEIFEVIQGKDVSVDEVAKIVAADPGAVTRRFALNGYRPYGDDEGTVSAIWLAAKHGHAEVVRFLADKGGDVDDCFNIDCLVVFCCHIAVQEGHLECLRVLREKGAKRIGHDLNLGNMATVAAAYNHPHVLDYLTSIGEGPVEDDGLDLWRPWGRSGCSKATWLDDKPDLRAAIQRSKDTVKN